MDDQLFRSWKRQVKNLEEVLKALSTKRVIAVGTTPYPKAVPAVFMTRRAYAIYSVQDSRDAETMREFVTVFSLGERHPKVAEKVRALSFLLKNYHFQAFLKSRKEPVTLLFSRTSSGLLSALDDSKIAWAGYDPGTCEKFLDREQFSKILDKYKLHRYPWRKLTKIEFLKKSYEELFKIFHSPLRIDSEFLGGKPGALVIGDEAELTLVKEKIQHAEEWQSVQRLVVLPVQKGRICNILACVTEEGILTSGLHFPIPDYTLSTLSHAASQSYGFVINPHAWPQELAIEAQVAAELIGEDLSKRGYVGVFGLEFNFEESGNQLYTTAFIPGFPPDSLEYSQKCLLSATPPPEFFSLAAFFKIPVKFDFEAVNAAWKKSRSVSSIAFSLESLHHMTMDLPPGAYRYDHKAHSAEFLGSKLFLHELASDTEFLIYDAVLRPGQNIPADARRSFKFFFRADILESKEKLLPQYAEIVENFASAIRGKKSQKENGHEGDIPKADEEPG